ncbi:MAG: hypothetical protein DLD55_01090 [candidate division SR1 bacterium]|nr:MAG: hypothetical protein DLD55_01090 [candidate division SR1 bacterium]
MNEMIKSVDEQLSLDTKIIEEMKGELKVFGKDVVKYAFYSVDDNGKQTADINKVNAFLNSIKDQEWNDLKDQKQDRLRMTAVQIKLVSLGYDIGSKKIDGWFGRATKAAIQKFQKDQEFAEADQDGLPGEKTIKALLTANPISEDKNNDTILVNNKGNTEKNGKQINLVNEKAVEQNKENIVKELQLRDVSNTTKEEERNFFGLPQNEKIYMREGFDGYYFFNTENHLTFIPDLRQNKREHGFVQQIYLDKEWKNTELPESQNLEEALKRHLFDSLQRYGEKYRYNLNYNKDKKCYELISNNYRIPINLSVLRGSGKLWEKNTFIGNRLQTLLLLARGLKLAKGQEGEFIITNLKNNPSIKGISFKKSPKHYNELIHPDRMQKKYPFLTGNAIKSCVDWLNKNHKTA